VCTFTAVYRYVDCLYIQLQIKTDIYIYIYIYTDVLEIGVGTVSPEIHVFEAVDDQQWEVVDRLANVM